ncbi:L-ascorbate 6-phosphate lactonase [Lachnotalea glycerini]|nr:MBL fold metallo-hydrolase [Lachnotalea glycerini]PXV85609.1 L-ascorbate 6-phosphate lactonase [Lachnotalea glycerini]
MEFVKKLNQCKVQEGELALFWLGQAGFIIKNSRGKTLVVDPYLSDAVERICGLKRLMMPVMEAEDLNPDLIVISHHDEDHLDMDIIPDIMKRNPNTRILAPDTSFKMCKEAGISEKQLLLFNKGTKVELDEYKLEAVFADHGDHAKDAIGMLVETEGHLIYFAGDTSFQCDRMQYAASKDIDILVLPINGEYGNMNSYEGVDLVKLVTPKLTIPSHFWTFIRHGSDPYTFDREMRIEAPNMPFYFMCQGEMIKWNGSMLNP